MKKTVFVIIATFIVIAVLIFAYTEYAAAADNADKVARIAVVERKLSDILKYDFKIKEARIEGDRIYGRVSAQNGYGATENDDFKAQVRRGDSDGFELIALYLYSKNGTPYVFDIRPGKAELSAKIDALYSEFSELEKANQTLSAKVKRNEIDLPAQTKALKTMDINLNRTTEIISEIASLERQRTFE